jgi:hypothetical protein
MNDTSPALSPEIASTFDPKPSKAALRVQARIAIVAEIIRENRGSIPTHLQILNELRRRGVKSSKGSVMNDLFALGLSDAPTAYGRGREEISRDF